MNDGKYGAFLVRESETRPGDFSMSVRVRTRHHTTGMLFNSRTVVGGAPPPPIYLALSLSRARARGRTFFMELMLTTVRKFR